MSSLTSQQQTRLAAIRGLAETIADITRAFPAEPCALLSSQVADVQQLATAMAIMARSTRIE